MRRLLIRNPDLKNEERVFLSSAYAVADGTSVSVVNSFALADNTFGVFGNPGEEKTEVKLISTIVSRTSITLASALSFPHPKDTVIIRTPWDQVEISRYTSGAWSIISTSGLQFDKQFTVYIDYDGVATDSYRWRFVNSNLSDYSEYSPTFSGGGFERNQAGQIVQNIRKVTKTDGDTKTVTDIELLRQVNTAQEIIYATRRDWWFLRFPTDHSLTTTGDTYSYNLDLLGAGTAGLPAAGYNLGYIKNIKYQLNDGASNDWWNLVFKSEVEFDDLIRDKDRTSDDEVKVYTLRPGDSSSKNGYLEVYPTPKTTGYGTFYIDGFQKPDDLDDFSDETLIPVPSVLELFGISYVERIRGNDTKAEYYEELFYGPAPDAEDRRRLTGIALLEQLNDQKRPTTQPRQLVKFMGQRGLRRLYGDSRRSSRDYLAENYF